MPILVTFARGLILSAIVIIILYTSFGFFLFFLFLPFVFFMRAINVDCVPSAIVCRGLYDYTGNNASPTQGFSSHDRAVSVSLGTTNIS